MIFSYSLGGVDWDRSLGCHGFVGQMFDDEPLLFVCRFGLIRGVGDILAGLFVAPPFVDFGIVVDIGQLQLLVG